MRTEASRNAYSKSELPSRSCWRRKAEFWTFLKSDSWIGESGRCGRVTVSMLAMVKSLPRLSQTSRHTLWLTYISDQWFPLRSGDHVAFTRSRRTILGLITKRYACKSHRQSRALPIQHAAVPRLDEDRRARAWLKRGRKAVRRAKAGAPRSFESRRGGRRHPWSAANTADGKHRVRTPPGTMPAKRPGDDEGAPPMPAKSSRTDLHIEYDASAGARRKGASNRTGQACDRCKVRSHTA